jgi:hypothetical protein
MITGLRRKGYSGADANLSDAEIMGGPDKPGHDEQNKFNKLLLPPNAPEPHPARPGWLRWPGGR